MIRFHCSKCALKLTAEPEYAGTSFACPGCGTTITVPQPEGGTEVSEASGQRKAWKESDPTNPNLWISLGIGFGIFAVLYLFALPFGKKSYFYQLLYERTWVNVAESILFAWGAGHLILKFVKFRHQQNALNLDVLPQELGREITKDSIHTFIAHVYALPVKLRDSMMVNRIRKALELFEVRQVNSEVATMMSNQSNIDSIRIGGSYTLVKVFIWAIPILGFVGTVLGLSGAIGGFQAVMGAAKDIEGLTKSMGTVTSNLGTSFDTTLLALIYSILLSIPMSSMQKQEDDNLAHIDAYCNETLLPRLNDGSNAAGGDMGALSEVLAASITRAHTQFLTGLDAASKTIREQSQGLEKRAEENNKAVQEQFNKAIAAFNESGTKTLTELGKSAGTSLETLNGTLKKATDQVAALEKVAQTQQALIDASVKQSLAKLHEDSSKVIGEAVKISVGETAKSIEGVIKPAVQQVSTLSDAVKAATVHVASLEKQASEHQQNVQKAMQESIARVQQDSSKLLGESIRATADQSAKAMEEVMKPAVSQLASIGETAKGAVQEAANLQKQAREQHSSAHKAFLDTTAQLQRELSKTLEDSIRPATQQLGSLAGSVKSAAEHVSTLERQAREQQAANDRLTQEAISRLQRDAVKAFEDALRPAAQELASLSESAKAAVTQLGTLERSARDSHSSSHQSAMESARQLQRDTSKSLEDTLRPVAQQLTALAEGIKATTAQLSALDRHAQEHQATVARSVETSVTKFQSEATRAADETMRTANAHLAALAQGIAALNHTLTDLNGKQIVVQQVTAPKGSFFRRLTGKG